MARNFTRETRKLWREIKARYIDIRASNPAARRRVDRIWIIASDRLDGAGTDDAARAILASLQLELKPYETKAGAG